MDTFRKTLPGLLKGFPKGFDELSANGFATRDSSSKWVLIRNFLTWNSVENPNQGIAALRLFDQVPDRSTVKPELARVLASAISHIGIAKLKGSEKGSRTVP